MAAKSQVFQRNVFQSNLESIIEDAPIVYVLEDGATPYATEDTLAFYIAEQAFSGISNSVFQVGVADKGIVLLKASYAVVVLS